MLRFLITGFLLFDTLVGFSQAVISGRLTDSGKKPIPSVSVSYKKIGATALSGFSRTDNDGQFKLSVKITDADSIQLDFNHLAYVKKSVVVPNKTASYTYTLTEGTRMLEEVKVDKMPVFRRKDTLDFNVSVFTSKQDRVIGDIIKKLPGIEMRGDQIFYQGKPIQKYMVNNLNLMEGRYGIINNNLPADAVKNVQVVENDQPIKILDSLVFSDRASLNLELKKFTTSGSGKIGIGMTPALWDINLTPMTFEKTFQMLNSFQSNNTGYDAARELRHFYTGGSFFSANEPMKDGPSYIYLQNVQSPGFDEKKWLDNRISLFSTNVLRKLKSGLELKGNVSYYDDSRQRSGFTSTRYFTSDETFVNTEGIDNRFRANVLDAGVLIEKNEKQIYLRNNLKYHKRWNSDRGDLLFNDDERIAQRRSYTDEAFMNELSMARFIGRQLVNIRSNIEWHNTPQRLGVIPGQLTDILNQGDPYDEMTQTVYYKGLRAINGLGFSRRIKHWIISPNIDVNYHNNSLETAISVKDEGQQKQLGEGYWNDVKTSQLQIALGSRFGFEKNKWKLSLSTPYSFFWYDVTQQGIESLSNTVKNTFNPSATATYLIDPNNQVSAHASAGRQFGGLDNFYDAYIISTYRNIQRYDNRLLASNSTNTGVRYSYANALKANFANVSYSYSRGKRDYIFRNRVDEMGRTTVSIDDHESSNYSHKLTGGVSRFFSTSKTVVKLNGNMAWSESDYLLNDFMDKQLVRSYGGDLVVNNNLSSIVSGEYKIEYENMLSEFGNGKNNRVVYTNHYLNISVFPADKHMIMVNNSYYGNNVSGYKDQFFLDATYRYRLEKWKTDIEFTAQNLLNNSRYVQQISTDYQLVQSYFDLRPRQFFISTRFRF